MIEPRHAALEVLYQSDQTGAAPELSGLTTKAARLVAGVAEHQPSIDRRIEAAAQHWRLDRMPAVDRCILRLAVYELQYEPETPVAVVISQAVELAKKFSTEKSGAFVNGILATLSAGETE